MAIGAGLASGAAFGQQAGAGTTVKDRNGWSASLFVAPVDEHDKAQDPAMRVPVPPVVNAAVSRKLSRHTRVGFDVFNVFDRKAVSIDYLDMSGTPVGSAPSDNYFFHPAEPRGFRLRLRISF